MTNAKLICTVCRASRQALIHAFKRPVVTLLDGGVSKPTVNLWCPVCKIKSRHVAEILPGGIIPRYTL